MALGNRVYVTNETEGRLALDHRRRTRDHHRHRGGGVRFFEQIGRKDRRVVLLLDEFDTLLDHPNFNGSAFFATVPR